MMSKNACFTGDYKPCVILVLPLLPFPADRGCSFGILKSTVSGLLTLSFVCHLGIFFLILSPSGK